MLLPLSIFGALAIGLEYLKVKIDKKLKEKFGESSEERINRLTNSLKEAALLSSQIEMEINRRQEIVEKLKSDARKYDELAKLKEGEIEAVVQTMRGELQNEGKKSLLISAMINLFFFIAGVIVNYLYLTIEID